MSARTWTLRLDKLTPPSDLLPNSRIRVRSPYAHKMAGLRHKQYRHDVRMVAESARNREGLPAPLFPGRVRVRVTVAWERYLAIGKTRTRYQYRSHPDPDGIDGAMKAVWDGLEDAGILANDRYLIREPVSQINDPDEDGYVLIEFVEEP